MQQKVLWAEVRKETGRGKGRFKIRDLPADGRCSQAVQDFLSTTGVGRLVPVEDDAREREKRRGGWRPRSYIGAVGDE